MNACQLKVLEGRSLTSTSVVERETVEKRGNDDQNDFVPDIGRSSPVLFQDSASNQKVLSQETTSKLILSVRNSRNWQLGELGFHSLELITDNLSLSGFEPDLVVVLQSVGTRSSSNDFQHPFGRVGLWRTFWRALWLGCQLNTNGQSLTLFNVQSFTSNTNNGVSILLHLQDVDNVLNVLVLLGFWNVLTLSQVCRESQSLSNSGSSEVQILLLNITGVSLERTVSQSTVNKHRSGNNTHGHTVSKHIQQCSLTSTRGTHKGSQSTRLDPTVNVIQNSSGFRLDFHLVANVSPVENVLTGDQLSNTVRRRGVLLQTGRLLAVGAHLHVLRNRGQLLLFLQLVKSGFLEHQDFTLLHGTLRVLNKNQVKGSQKHTESHHDTKVSPSVAPLVTERLVDVSVTVNFAVTCLSTNN
ncbi:hypothetical protein OGAPHI_004786 [Ogataea philodendri]|uniref:Uncharacterized protein n=1 Tax=Ogataea philodendri TaxID=1378263 RepID=A0A9P8P2N3_9ASCO|nr:uncharacterized protein OGAPHI_004786 [Ogataea philodendri]KAH3664072.1 hypothetical protein OGAPHI_004786 [Ogataea philodendri]